MFWIAILKFFNLTDIQFRVLCLDQWLAISPSVVAVKFNSHIFCLSTHCYYWSIRSPPAVVRISPAVMRRSPAVLFEIEKRAILCRLIIAFIVWHFFSKIHVFSLDTSTVIIEVHLFRVTLSFLFLLFFITYDVPVVCSLGGKEFVIGGFMYKIMKIWKTMNLFVFSDTGIVLHMRPWTRDVKKHCIVEPYITNILPGPIVSWAHRAYECMRLIRPHY